MEASGGNAIEGASMDSTSATVIVANDVTSGEKIMLCRSRQIADLSLDTAGFPLNQPLNQPVTPTPSLLEGGGFLSVWGTPESVQKQLNIREPGFSDAAIRESKCDTAVHPIKFSSSRPVCPASLAINGAYDYDRLKLMCDSLNKMLAVAQTLPDLAGDGTRASVELVQPARSGSNHIMQLIVHYPDQLVRINKNLPRAAIALFVHGEDEIHLINFYSRTVNIMPFADAEVMRATIAATSGGSTVVARMLHPLYIYIEQAMTTLLEPLIPIKSFRCECRMDWLPEAPSKYNNSRSFFCCPSKVYEHPERVCLFRFGDPDLFLPYGPTSGHLLAAQLCDIDSGLHLSKIGSVKVHVFADVEQNRIVVGGIVVGSAKTQAAYTFPGDYITFIIRIGPGSVFVDKIMYAHPDQPTVAYVVEKELLEQPEHTQSIKKSDGSAGWGATFVESEKLPLGDNRRSMLLHKFASQLKRAESVYTVE